MGASLKFKGLGILFLCLLLAGIWLTYGVFTQKFTHFDEVTLDAPTIGLQMPERADVKIRGVIVGEVLGFSATDRGATVRLGIFPSQMHTIPSNVTGAIVPKTLFGEKYVSLVVPGDKPAPTSLEPNAVIPRTQVPVEVQKVLADLYPLLRTVRLTMLPVVVLFGPSDPVHWAPWRTEGHVLTSPDSIDNISVGEVISAAETLRVRA